MITDIIPKLINKVTVINYNVGRNAVIKAKLMAESKRQNIIILLLVVKGEISIPNTTPNTIPPI